MKANKKMYPGGGMLRNKYAQGGAIPMTEKEKRQLQMIKGLDPLRPNFPRLPDQRSIGQVYGKLQTRVNPPQASNVQPSRITTTQQPTTATPTTATPTTAKTASSSGSFSKAFADARAKGLKEFTWNGKKYTTQIKGGGTEKPQATRNAEPVSKMPMKAVASVTKPYFESPTGVMQPASVKTTEMRGATVQKMPMKPATSVQASTDKGNQYFKPGTMAEYLEERRRKMQSNLMTKR